MAMSPAEFQFSAPPGRICVVVIEPLPDNEVDCWRGASGMPYATSTVFPEVIWLKLSNNDAGMWSAIELMDPFQDEFLWCGKYAQPIRLHEICEYLPQAA